MRLLLLPGGLPHAGNHRVDGLDMSNFENPDAASGETAWCPRCGSEALIGDKAGFQ